MIRIAKNGIAAMLCVLITATSGHAQDDAIMAIQKIFKAYNSANPIRFSGSLKMYAQHDPAKIIERMQSSYIIKDKYFNCRLGPVEMLLNDNYYVSVDRRVKIIMIGRKKDLSTMAGVPVLNLDQIKKQIDEKKIQAVNISKGFYSILQLADTSGDNGFNIYKIEYNTLTGNMKKVIYELRASAGDAKTMVLEIHYTEPVHAADNNNLFSEKTFFSIVNNKIQLTAEYKGFEVINQL